jgi:ankyrin repeat protein
VDACGLLLDAGASPSEPNVDNVLPLHYLLKSERLQVAGEESQHTPRDLEGAGMVSSVDKDSRFQALVVRMLGQVDVNHLTRFRESFLHYACRSSCSKEKIIELLIERGCPLGPNR